MLNSTSKQIHRTDPCPACARDWEIKSLLGSLQIHTCKPITPQLRPHTWSVRVESRAPYTVHRPRFWHSISTARITECFTHARTSRPYINNGKRLDNRPLLHAYVLRISEHGVVNVSFLPFTRILSLHRDGSLRWVTFTLTNNQNRNKITNSNTPENVLIRFSLNKYVARFKLKVLKNI